MLGVDLGTSHTVAMLRWPDGRVRPLLFDGLPLLPSAVHLDPAGRLHVGRDAIRLGHADPARLEPHPKRHVDAETVLLGGSDVPVPDLLAALLEAVAREAVAAAGELPPAVVTCPAAWGAQRREVLTRALALAGWPPSTQLTPEPVAAARYFAEVLRKPVPVGSALAVFDFGGGTLDIAVVRNEGPDPDGRARFVVAASGGLDDLGGLDIDAALVAHLGAGLATSQPAAWAALNEPVTLAQWRARRQFWDDVRGAKEMLSRAGQAPVPVPGVEHAVQLTRDELEMVAAPLIRRGVAEAGTVVRAAGLTPADLAGLFLVGGSSRVPLVARLLHSELGVAPTVIEQPELPVAEGAILVAAQPETPVRPLQAAAVRPQTDTMAKPPAPATEDAGQAPRPAAALGAAAAGLAAPGPSTAPGPPAAANAGPGAAAAGPAAPAEAEPRYAEPVDPWATGEAAALAANGVPFAPPAPSSPEPWPASAQGQQPGSPAEPWLASAQGHHPMHPGPGAASAGTGGVRPAYRRKGLWIVAAVTVVVLGVAATVVALVWRGYSALDYQPLSEPRRVKPVVPVTSAFSAATLRDGRAYFASAGDTGQLGVVAAEADSGRTVWTSTEAGTAARWEFFFTVPHAVVAISDTDSTTRDRRMVMLDPGDGRRMWERRISGDDNVFFAGDTAVLVDRAENRILGLEIRGKGKAAWEKKNPTSEYGLSTTRVVTATTPGDLTGAATTGGVPFAAPMEDDRRIVQIGGDRSARVIDARSGDEVAGPRPSVADPDDPVVAHNGRLVVAESGATDRIVAYDLGKLGEPAVPYTLPDNSQVESLTACGDDRVCFVRKTGYDAKTAQVVAVDVVEGGVVWSRAAPDAQTLVPVGDAVLVAQNSTPAQVTLLDGDGEVAWTRAGAAGRLDGGNLLLFSKPLSTSADDPALSGVHVGDAAVPLGSLSDVRSASCSWDQQHLACAAAEDFVVHTFASE